MNWKNDSFLVAVMIIGAGAILQLTVFAAPAEVTEYERNYLPTEVRATTASLPESENTPSEALLDEPTEEISEEPADIEVREEPEEKVEEIREVPFYSQLTDITPAAWKGIGCGIASLAMLIDYYEPAVTVDVLLQEGISSGAYIRGAGWSHAGLIRLAQKYNLDGKTVGLDHLGIKGAFDELRRVLEEGPVMVSVHYTFDPQNPIPHLVVINDVKDNIVYYNDPAEEAGGGTISVEQFKRGWKQRFIQIRPA